MAKRISTDKLQKYINTLSMREVLAMLEEDNVVDFDKRNYLSDLPDYKLKNYAPNTKFLKNGHDTVE